MSDTIVKPLPYRVDLAETIKKTYLDTLFATEDNEAHRFDIALFKDKAQLNLPSGTAVNGYFIRYSDNATLPLGNGSVSGNVCSVTLKKACYNKSGQFAVIIKATDGDVINTVFYGEGTMFASSTDTVMDEENIIPSLEDLLAQIATIEAVTKDAKDAADAANAAAEHAPYVNASNNHWMVWDTVSGKYVDTGVMATGPQGPKGDPGTIENVTITSINGLPEALEQLNEANANKLGKTETAADSKKLGGADATEYVKKTELPSGGADPLTIYPVGSIYMSMNETSPASLFGGTWEQIKGRFLLGTGAPENNDNGESPGNYSFGVGVKYGRKEETLTTSQIPKHAHGYEIYNTSGSSGHWYPFVWNQAETGDGQYRWTTEAGEGAPHNNMPPYLTVHMWKRVS